MTSLEIKALHKEFDDFHAIRGVDLFIEKGEFAVFVGPSGCGKSTFLRCLNRMNDTISIARIEGDIRIDGEDLYDRRVDPVQLRAKVGMVSQKPNPCQTRPVAATLPRLSFRHFCGLVFFFPVSDG